MASIVLVEPNKVCRTDVSLSMLPQYLAQPDTLVWLDFNTPTSDEIEILRKYFQFHPLAIEDAVRQYQRPKIDAYEHYYFVVFYSAKYDDGDKTFKLLPLHLFIGHNFLVTVHRDAIPALDETINRWKSPDTPLGRTVGSLVYALLDAIVDNYFPLIDLFADQIDQLETTIFEDSKDDSIQTIFQLKKDLLALRRVVAPERDVLNVMMRREIAVFSSEDIIYLQDVYDHVLRVTDSVDTYRDLLSSALDSFLSLQSNRLNQIVKVLTVTSIVLMTNSLIAGIYGMNFDFMPELHWRFGYAWALGLMVAATIGLVAFFKRMRWI